MGVGESKMKVVLTMDLKDVKNMGCDYPLCNKKIQVLDFVLVGTRFFTKRYCTHHYVNRTKSISINKDSWGLAK